MNGSDRIDQIWSELQPTLGKLLSLDSFSLSLPCVVVKEDQAVIETSLSGLASHLNASAALSSPELTAFSELASKHSYEEAFEMLIEGTDGETFAERWDEAQTDIGNGSFCSIADVVRAIGTAREGFERKPRSLLVVVETQEGLEVLLVSSRSQL